MPLPLGEVAERSEVGEGKLNVPAKPSQSPAATALPERAKQHENWSVSVPIRSINCFTAIHQIGAQFSQLQLPCGVFIRALIVLQFPAGQLHGLTQLALIKLRQRPQRFRLPQILRRRLIL